ncbi:MAG: imidazolonepropionase-like amidohydrolase, partial [Gammaproteobacteria bacterium]
MKQQFGTQSMTFTGMQIVRRVCLLGLVLVAGSARAAALGDKYAVKVGRILTMEGEEIAGGVIVMEGGRITAVGSEADVQIPWDADVLDAPDLVAFPGFVEAHSSRGMDRPNENLDLTPFLRVRDSVDPVNFYFEDCLRAGVTTINIQHGASCVIGAQGMVVRPHGMTVEQMTVRPVSGIKMSVAPKSGKSHSTQLQVMRGAFDDLRQHLQELVQGQKDGDDHARREALYQGRDLEGEAGEGRAMAGIAWTVDGLETVARGEIDEKQEPLLDVVEGRLPVWMYCGSARDVAPAIEVAKQNGFLDNMTLVLDESCWKAVDIIAQAGLSVVLDAELTHIELDPVTGKEIETFVPAVFAEKGVPFALASLNSSTQSLWYQAAMCVSHGVERQAALAAVTSTPSGMLNLGEQVGKIASGYEANVVLFSGDPLSVTSAVEYVILNG